MSKDKFYHSRNVQRDNRVEVSNETQLVAIDTNVFLDMAHRMVGSMDNNGILTDNFYDRLEIIRELANQKKVKFVVTPVVLNELLHHGLSKSEVHFMNRYCLILKPKNKEQFASLTNDLAREYIKSGIMKMGKGQHRFNDSFAMAEAAVAGLNLLTNNIRDFIIYDEVRSEYKFDEYGDLVPKKGYKDEMIPAKKSNFNENEINEYLKIKGYTRAFEIRKLNNGILLSYTNRNGFKVIPTPFTTIDYIGKNKHTEGLWKSNQFVTNFNSKDFELTSYEREK